MDKSSIIESLMLRGSHLLKAHDLDAAEATFSAALSFTRGNPDAFMQRAIVRFHQGDYGSAWKDFKARHDANWAKANGWSHSPRDLTALAPYYGDKASTGILVVAEGGAGDTVQFARFVPLLQKCNPYIPIVFEVQNPLVDLVKSFPGFESIIVIPRTMTDPADASRKIAPPLSRMINSYIRLLGVPDELGFVSLEKIGRDAPPPYEAQKIAVRPGEPLKIGLCWRGDPNNTFDAGRDVALEKLLPLINSKNVIVTSLLDDMSEAERALAPNLKLPGAPGQRVSFTDMAKLIREQDMVISSDTVWPNLAATLGVPTLMFALRTPNWRWGLSGETTPWYPSMTLLRQTAENDWSAPLQTMQTIVQELVDQRFPKASAVPGTNPPKP